VREQNKRTTPAEDFKLRLKLAAADHDGVAPLPFVGTTWQHRGVRYWFRRALAWLTLIFCTALCGGLAAGVTVGILHGGRGIVGAVIACVYWATIIPGLVYGIRMAKVNPAGPRSGGGGLGSGCVSIVISPIVTGICLGYLVMTFGREFPGEPVAREVTARNQWINESLQRTGDASNRSTGQ
jgi:hypothetical protein